MNCVEASPVVGERPNLNSRRFGATPIAILGERLANHSIGKGFITTTLPARVGHPDRKDKIMSSVGFAQKTPRAAATSLAVVPARDSIEHDQELLLLGFTSFFVRVCGASLSLST